MSRVRAIATAAVSAALLLAGICSGGFVFGAWLAVLGFFALVALDHWSVA